MRQWNGRKAWQRLDDGGGGWGGLSAPGSVEHGWLYDRWRIVQCTHTPRSFQGRLQWSSICTTDNPLRQTHAKRVATYCPEFGGSVNPGSDVNIYNMFTVHSKWEWRKKKKKKNQLNTMTLKFSTAQALGKNRALNFTAVKCTHRAFIRV